MKLLAMILGVIVLLGAVLAASMLFSRRSPPADCTARVVMMKGPDGRPVECVCIEGALATCFNPGP